MAKEKPACEIEMRWECPKCGLQSFVTIKEMMHEAIKYSEFQHPTTLQIPECDDCYNVMELDEEYMSKAFKSLTGHPKQRKKK